MFISALLVALQGAAWAAGSGGEQCARGAVTRFSVRGGYNASGHWEGEVRVERDPQLRGRPGLLLEVEAWPSRCGQVAMDVLLVHASEMSPSTPAPKHISREGYQQLPGLGSYKLHGITVSWDEANNTCVSEGAHLLVLDTQQEADEIQKLINKLPKPSDWFHIGFHDKRKTRNYMTVLGYPLLSTNYNRWYPGEPDSQGSELCGGISKNLALIDIDCTIHKAMFICEVLF